MYSNFLTLFFCDRFKGRREGEKRMVKPSKEGNIYLGNYVNVIFKKANPAEEKILEFMRIEWKKCCKFRQVYDDLSMGWLHKKCRFFQDFKQKPLLPSLHKQNSRRKVDSRQLKTTPHHRISILGKVSSSFTNFLKNHQQTSSLSSFDLRSP